ncbi:MAG: PHP domain-containing protein [Candidatus Omnitrophota bacterium]
MMLKADLHIHSSFSDGSDSPEQVVEIAIGKELGCIALSDHDTVDGLEPAWAAGREKGIEVLSGVELSTYLNGADIHILGYCFDIYHPRLTERLQFFCQVRLERVKKIVAKLNQMGIPIKEEEVLSLAPFGAVGRLHVARALLKAGYVQQIEEAFDRFIAEGRSAYFPKSEQTPFEAINLIHAAGGVAVMAHPMVTMRDELISSFVKEGLDGLEVCYPNTPPRLTEFYARLADKHGLIKTGGSDAHGRFRDYSPIGIVRVDYSVVEQLKQKALKYKS